MGRAGSFGRFSLGLGALSGVVSAVGAIGLGIYDSKPWWSMFFLGMVFQFLGLALFGMPTCGSVPYRVGMACRYSQVCGYPYTCSWRSSSSKPAAGGWRRLKRST
jgi:hypothetical protein